MKIFVVALAFLVGTSADQLEKSPPILFAQMSPELPEPIDQSYALDSNEPNLKDLYDVSAVNEEDSLQAVPIDHNTYIMRSIITNVIKYRIDSLRKSIPDSYRISDNFLSVTLNERGFAAKVQNVEIKGLNNINTDNIDVNIWATKATIVLRLPKVEVHCGKVGLDLTVFDSKLSATKSGTVSLSNIVILINITINPIRLTVTGVEVSLIFAGPVQSKLNAQLFGADVSRAVNDLVENIIPAVLAENKGKLEGVLQDKSAPFHDLNDPVVYATSFYL